MNKRIRATITGRVQGVGFRPTVYRYATDFNLVGFVKNAPQGVVCEVEGCRDTIAQFLNYLKKNPPSQASIDDVVTEEVPVSGEPGFSIVPSRGSGDLLVGMPPDLATCSQCLDELFNPDDRRFRYPFINCTNCGPRFTIIRELPYDRDKTSMNTFTLCPDCSAEYHDPADRRFDAQPNACAVCGPELALMNTKGETLQGDPIIETARLLREGNILAIKGLGGYHLCCDAASDESIAQLRKRKNRPAKSLAVMFSSIDEIKEHCIVTDHEEKELTSVSRPIVILPQKDGSDLSQYISPDTKTIGAFLTYTPLHHLLLAEISPLIMTSGNRAEEPIVNDEKELEQILGTIADYALNHNRPIVRRCDDSVLQIVRGTRLFIRRSRGYVPDCITLPYDSPSIIACGAELKNTFCITRGRQAFVSQHIGDLTEYKAFAFYRDAVDDLTRLLQVTPEIITHDMHPDYESTRYALDSPIERRIAVWHHHAHIAACMAEHQITEPVIGVALDGTGYGTDGKVWGGEFMVADLLDFRRVAHFKEYPLPGGDAAVLHPIRMALSCCLKEFGNTLNPFCRSLFERTIAADEYTVLVDMIEKGIRSPATSSCGRLFDAVAALCGICSSITYEGQAAIKLQQITRTDITTCYPYTIDYDEKGRPGRISFGPMIKEIVADLKGDTDIGEISAAFHNTIAAGVTDMCNHIRQSENINSVVLSGGVFQNDLLLDLMIKHLQDGDFNVFYHTLVPPNDAGIALGQAAIACARYQAGKKESQITNDKSQVPNKSQ